MTEPFIIQNPQDFLAAYISLYALVHQAPGATYKKIMPDGTAAVEFLPRYKVETEAVVDLIKACDFSTHRVVVWQDLNPSAKTITEISYVATIASLERMARALPLQLSDEQMRLECQTVERDRAEAISPLRQTVNECELLCKLVPDSHNLNMLQLALDNLNQVTLFHDERLKATLQHHQLAYAVRQMQEELGWAPEPDQTEKRLILGAVSEAVQNLENLYRKS